MAHSRRHVMIQSGSTSTSGPVFVGDYVQMTASWQSSGSLGPSRFTIEVSNADGFQSADLGNATSATNWSLATGVNMIGLTPGVADLTEYAGVRWMRVTVAPANHSTASATTITVTGNG